MDDLVKRLRDKAESLMEGGNLWPVTRGLLREAADALAKPHSETGFLWGTDKELWKLAGRLEAAKNGILESASPPSDKPTIAEANDVAASATQPEPSPARPKLLAYRASTGYAALRWEGFPRPDADWTLIGEVQLIERGE